jgi:chaperonin GroEL (HSP60 family)
MQEKMKAKVDAIAAHGVNCFVNRQLMYNHPESLLAEKGIMVIEHADVEGVEHEELLHYENYVQLEQLTNATLGGVIKARRHILQVTKGSFWQLQLLDIIHIELIWR